MLPCNRCKTCSRYWWFICILSASTLTSPNVTKSNRQKSPKIGDMSRHYQTHMHRGPRFIGLSVYFCPEDKWGKQSTCTCWLKCNSILVLSNDHAFLTNKEMPFETRLVIIHVECLPICSLSVWTLEFHFTEKPNNGGWWIASVAIHDIHRKNEICFTILQTLLVGFTLYTGAFRYNLPNKI